MNLRIFIIFNQVILGVLLVIFMFVMIFQIDDLHEATDRCEMYDPNNFILTKTNGLYFFEGYYCVWTEGRTLEEINRTDVHEVCHSLVVKDKEHFCEWQ